MENNIRYLLDKIDRRYPFTLIDVGAMGGIAAKWNPIMEEIKIIAFEPDAREYAKLTSTKNIKYLNCALNDKSEDLKYYLTRAHGRSSLFKPDISFLKEFEDSERFIIEQEGTIPATLVKTLDTVIDQEAINDLDFIKIDTEASELPILVGGQKNMIPKIFGAQIEVWFAAIRKKQPLFRDIDAFMSDNGFQLMDLKRYYWKRQVYYDYHGRGQLIFGDSLYFKNIDVLFKELSQLLDKAQSKSKVIKSILTCLIYKLFDYAALIAKKGLEHGYLTGDEQAEIMARIKKASRRDYFYGLPLDSRLFDRFNTLLKKFKPLKPPVWGFSDDEIGNIIDA